MAGSVADGAGDTGDTAPESPTSPLSGVVGVNPDAGDDDTVSESLDRPAQGSYVGIDRETAKRIRRNKKPDMHLLNIRDECRVILDAVKELTADSFAASAIIQRGIGMCLTNIGEDVHKLSKSFKRKHREINWDRWTISRNLIVHGYRFIYMDTVCNTVTEDVPLLLADVEALIQEVVNPGAPGATRPYGTGQTG